MKVYVVVWDEAHFQTYNQGVVGTLDDAKALADRVNLEDHKRSSISYPDLTQVPWSEPDDTDYRGEPRGYTERHRGAERDWYRQSIQEWEVADA